MMNTLYDHPRDYDAQYTDYEQDVPFWVWAAGEYSRNKPILEFACGTGRVTLRLAEQGYRVVGVDLSEHMLRACRQKLSLSGLQGITLHHGDMCDFQTGEKHNLVIVPFTSFLHVTGAKNQIAALRNFHSQMGIDGHLVVDIFNPNVERLARGLDKFSEAVFEKRVKLPDGSLLVRYQTTEYFPALQQSKWVFYIEIYDGETNEMVRKYTEEAVVQLIFPNEWRLLLAQAGFEIVEEYGDFERNRFSDSSPRMVFVAKKV